MLQLEVYGKIKEPSTLQGWLPRCQALQVLHLGVDTLRDNHFPVLLKLVELKLFLMIHTPLTTRQFSNILHGCPIIHRLTLEEVELENSNTIQLVPAQLLHLKALKLQYVDVPSVLPLLLSTSSSLSLSITVVNLNLSNNNFGDHLRALSGQATVTALQLSIGTFEWQELHKILRMLPHLLTLSITYTLVDEIMARVLRGTSELNTDEEIASSAFPPLDAIWLTESPINDETALRLLVSLKSLKQLKLNHRYLPLNAFITQSKDLCKHLAEAVPELTIVDRDEYGEEVNFP